MKRACIVLALLAVASAAMGASLSVVAPLGTATSSQVRALTPDGQYAIGFAGGGTSDRAFLWTAGGGTSGPLAAGSYMSEGNGIAYRTNPTSLVQELVIGGKQSSGNLGVFVSADNGVSWTRVFDSGGLTGLSTGASNAVAGNGSNAYFGWVNSSGTTWVNNITTLSGDPATPTTAAKNNASGQQAYANGISGTGVLVGSRKNGPRQNCFQIGTSQTLFAGLDGTNVGQTSAVSGDGLWLFGQSPIVGDATNNYPYKKDRVGGGITALPLLPGTTGSVNLGYVYGASADGRYAVGMDYVGMERAVLWDTQLGTVIDLTTFAAQRGILDGFTGNLRRAYTMGINSQGDLIIGGMGVWDDPATPGTTEALTRGFILTVPEPATLAFLALGALPLLRRRR